jgi:hypothetical protein
MSQNSELKVARTNLAAVEGLVGIAWLKSSTVKRHRSMLNRISRVIALNLEPRSSSDNIVYLTLRPYTNGTYVGCTTMGLQRRMRAHWCASQASSAKFYTHSNPLKFYMNIFIPIDNMSTSRMSLLSSEANYMSALMPPLNTQQNSYFDSDHPTFRCGVTTGKLQGRSQG